MKKLVSKLMKQNCSIPEWMEQEVGQIVSAHLFFAAKSGNDTETIHWGLNDANVEERLSEAAQLSSGNGRVIVIFKDGAHWSSDIIFSAVDLVKDYCVVNAKDIELFETEPGFDINKYIYGWYTTRATAYKAICHHPDPHEYAVLRRDEITNKTTGKSVV